MNKGFTLIEILISIIIFSIIIALASYSFSLYANDIKKMINPYPSEAVNVSRLDDALRSVFYFTASKENIYGEKHFFVYFYGNNNSMQFITAEPINIKSIAVCKLFLDNGTLKLEESPVYCKFNDYKNPFVTEKCIKDINILNNIEQLDIMYYKNGNKLTSLKEEIPEFIEMKLTNKNDKKFTLLFKVMSNFESKKGITQFMYYHP